MNTFLCETIKNIALSAGLPKESVFSKSAKDNLTIPRPRLEYEFLPANYTKTGKKLGISRTQTTKTRKVELYSVEQNVNCEVFANNEEWLADFRREFVKALPKGINDPYGNFVKILMESDTPESQGEKRVGEEALKVFTKTSTLFVLHFKYRITNETTVNLIPSIHLQTPKWERK